MKLPEFEKLERQRKILGEQVAADKPKRELLEIEISADYGETWKLFVLSVDCMKEIEPPLQRHKLGVAHSKNCEWCGAKNII